MSAHTPGPWIAGAGVVSSAAGDMIADFVRPEDARLIAAAPELLTFVQAFAEVPTEGEVPGTWNDKAAMDRMILIARKLVAKAAPE